MMNIMNHEGYTPQDIEGKWQKHWEREGLYRSFDHVPGKENFYALSEFAYPSGNLHVGHWYAFAVPDIYARYKRMLGYNVLYPMGFDAFGLPAENAAIKRGLDPRAWTYDNMEHMRTQLMSMGASFDWERSIATCDPSYYRWTQWMFLRFFEAGLVERKMTKTNWCDSCKTVLANEQVLAGSCERCGSEVVQKDMAQWMLKITDFADDLVDDLADLPWSESIKQAQREWVGRTEGSIIDFPLKGHDDCVSVFTTRADTLFGVSYVVLAPEHPLLDTLKDTLENVSELENYLKEVAKKSDLDRQQSKEKTGLHLLGVSVEHPLTGESLPLYVADYVLPHVGTGAVMAVPAHDERDAAFALRYDLPFRCVVLPSAGPVGNSRVLELYGETDAIIIDDQKDQASINDTWNRFYDALDESGAHLAKGSRFSFSYEGKVINSPGYAGMSSAEARVAMTEAAQGRVHKSYRLRDWGISRQRYWGCPIPIVYDPEGKAHAVPDEHLPWVLPCDVDHRPDGTAPLARSEELKKRTEDIFGEGWTPEVDTMDTFVDSSWYFYRYLDNHNDNEFASKEVIKNWMPVAMYFGGAEHTTMHLLYSRFWVKALHRLGLIEHTEPYQGRLNRGLILGPDGAKMSKSKGNVINPDEVVAHVGADTVRMYLAFIGPFNEPGTYPWDPHGVVGVRRFLDRVWRLQEKISEASSDPECDLLLHQTIKKVGEDVDRLKLNTAISSLMILVNRCEKAHSISRELYASLLRMLAPFAPHMTEELWYSVLGYTSSIHTEAWPSYDPHLYDDRLKPVPVQINGKVRAHYTGEETGTALKQALVQLPELEKWISGKEIKKIIHVPGKIINIVL